MPALQRLALVPFYLHLLPKMIPTDYAKLIRFLQDELAIPQSAIKHALQRCNQDPGPLPMILWQQGVLSLKQLERIFDWMEVA
ncbi:MAG: DUF2949 domain-containing protein [Phormidesmis sp.]